MNILKLLLFYYWCGEDVLESNNTTVIGNQTTPAITHNRSEPLSYPGREVFFTWETPGKQVGYNNSFTTNTTAGEPKVNLVCIQAVVLANLNPSLSRGSRN